MNKKIVIFSLSTTLIIIAAVGYAFSMADSQKDNTGSSKQASKPTNEPTESTPTTTSESLLASESAAQKGAYIAYSADAVANTAGRKLLFFHAPWCPQCRDLDASITQTGVPNDTTIFKVDYDSATALRQKYGVTIQTTIVEIDDHGNLIKKYVAYDQPNLAAVLKALE